MSKDYYTLLEVKKDASESEIKKAFYKLAQKYHPDKPDGDEAKFKEINEAYQVLSNKEKRAQYDRFGSADPRMGGAGAGGFDFSGFGGFGGGQRVEFDFGGMDINDILSQFGMGGFGFQGRPKKGKDAEMHLQITFAEACLGVSKEIEVPDLSSGKQTKATKKVKLTIPAGVEQGQRVRLEGYGYPLEGAPSGNLYLSLVIEPHPTLKREGNHLVTHVDIKLSDALLGTTLQIPSLDTTLEVKVPAGIQTGQLIRVRGKGVASHDFFGRGDFVIVPTVLMPKKLSKKVKEAISLLQEEGL